MKLHDERPKFEVMEEKDRSVLYRPAYVMLLLKFGYLSFRDNTRLFGKCEEVILDVLEKRLVEERLAHKTWIIYYGAFTCANGGERLLEWGWRRYQHDEVFRAGALTHGDEFLGYVSSRHVYY